MDIIISYGLFTICLGVAITSIIIAVKLKVKSGE